jgi:serpin B
MNQRVRILVNEEGTEAASVSVAEIGESANVINPGPFVFHADHPFAYFITENKTGAILLQGVYL